MNRTQIDIHLKKNQKVQISSVDSTGWYMSFQPFGRFNPRHPESMNAYKYIYKFTKAELFLLHEICIHTGGNSKLTLRPRSYVPAEQAKLKTAIPSWIKKGLLIRLKREYYMVNPWFLTPRKGEQLAAMDAWRAISGTRPRHGAIAGVP